MLKWNRRKAVSNSVAGDHIVVVGAGLSGLSAALYLLGAGYRVTVVDAADHVGGRCATEEISCPTPAGVVSADFDTGATVWTMPGLVDDALAAVGMTLGDVDPDVDVTKLSPAYHATFHDGRSLDVFGEQELMEAQLEEFIAAGAADTSADSAATIAGYRRMRAWLEHVFDASFDNFMSRSFDTPLNMVGDKASITDLLKLARLGAFGGLEGKIRSFLPDDLLSRVFSFQALYAGVAPRRARAVYGCISHMDTSMGVFYPLASRFGCGLGVIAEAMAAAVTKAGGTLCLNTPVSGVTINSVSRTIAAVQLDSPHLSTLACDGMIATTDVDVVEQWLDDAGWVIPHRPVPLRYSPSAVVAHGLVPVSVTKQWVARHHTISFGEHWNETFVEISSPRNGRVMSDPSLLVTRPSVSDPARIVRDADGQLWEPVSVLAPCPNLQSANIAWDAMAADYVAELLAELNRRGFCGIASGFVTGRIDTPTTWADHGMSAGSPFGVAHLFRQTGPFRPRNFSDRMPGNIVLAGSTTVPGVGVPTVMVSGRLAAERFSTSNNNGNCTSGNSESSQR